MVNTEKVYLMTKAAIFEKKEKKRALRIVNYRRKDYILSRMLLILLSASIAYAIIVGAILFAIVMAYESIVLSVSQMLLILLGIFTGYAIVLIFYYVVSHKFYGELHVKAKQDVKQYMSVLRALDHLNAKGKEQ